MIGTQREQKAHCVLGVLVRSFIQGSTSSAEASPLMLLDVHVLVLLAHLRSHCFVLVHSSCFVLLDSSGAIGRCWHPIGHHRTTDHHERVEQAGHHDRVGLRFRESRRGRPVSTLPRFSGPLSPRLPRFLPPGGTCMTVGQGVICGGCSERRLNGSQRRI